MRRGIRTGFWWESQKERDHYAGVMIILKSILEKLDGVMSTGFIWLAVGTIGELL
jgi:hypothetical protein